MNTPLIGKTRQSTIKYYLNFPIRKKRQLWDYSKTKSIQL